jgi:hypothetical protein
MYVLNLRQFVQSINEDEEQYPIRQDKEILNPSVESFETKVRRAKERIDEIFPGSDVKLASVENPKTSSAVEELLSNSPEINKVRKEVLAIGEFGAPEAFKALLKACKCEALVRGRFDKEAGGVNSADTFVTKELHNGLFITFAWLYLGRVLKPGIDYKGDPPPAMNKKTNEIGEYTALVNVYDYEKLIDILKEQTVDADEPKQPKPRILSFQKTIRPSGGFWEKIAKIHKVGHNAYDYGDVILTPREDKKFRELRKQNKITYDESGMPIIHKELIESFDVLYVPSFAEYVKLFD